MTRRFCGTALLVLATHSMVTANRGVSQTPTRSPLASISTSAVDRRTSLVLLQKWVPFSPGSATLGALATSFLDDKASLLALNPGLGIRVDATGRDVSGASAAGRLAQQRNDAVRAYLIGHGVKPSQILVPQSPTGLPADVAETRIGARIELATSSEDAAMTITALKQTPTIVHTRPGFEVFTLPRNLANDSVRILCAPPAAARFGVADTAGVVSGFLLPKSLVFIARDGATVFTLQHDISLVADPDKVDMTAQSTDPRCR